MSLAEFGTILSSLKSAGDMARALVDVRDATLLQTKVFDLTREILNAQQSALSAQASQNQLMDEVRALKGSLASYENWSNEEKRYALKDFGDNTYAYELKDDCKSSEPTHRLCPTCFQKRSKSILQFRGHTMSNQEIYNCPPCNKDFFFGVSRRTDGNGYIVSGDWMSA